MGVYDGDRLLAFGAGELSTDAGLTRMNGGVFLEADRPTNAT